MTHYFNQNIKAFAKEPFFNELKKVLSDKEKQLFENSEKNSALFNSINNLPSIYTDFIDLSKDIIKLGSEYEVSELEQQKIEKIFKSLRPWRKGPFNIFGVDIDSEWQSFRKWNRLKNHISNLKGKTILDIGSNCGYYMFKMKEQNPAVMIGIEPLLLYVTQYLALQHFAKIKNMFCFPLKFEESGFFKNYFDTVFCMGILYHRKSPLEFLTDINSSMKRGGELMLETLIIPGNKDIALFPADRYSKMNNVYFIPTLKCLVNWLKKCGFKNIEHVNTSKTSLKEQRKTEWMEFESLEDFLNPEDKTKTIEGYPAPRRAIVTAQA